MDLKLNDELKTAAWRKSSFSSGNGECIEIAPLSGGRVAIRDTEAPHKEPYVVRGAVWAAFTAGVRNAEFDF
jgi:hypothetical protein